MHKHTYIRVCVYIYITYLSSLLSPLPPHAFRCLRLTQWKSVRRSARASASCLVGASAA